MDKMDIAELEKVKELLRDIQLDQFYRQIHGKLHITRLSHFDHVTEDDLDDLGMAKPEQRRLFEALKKAKKKSLFSSFKRKKTKKGESHPDVSADRMSCYGVAGDSLTCLISEQSLTLYEMLGNGAFGYVRRGKWVKDSRKKLNVAVKCLKAWNDQAFQQMQMEFIKEANAMSLLDHPHIIRLHGIVLSVPMMLVTELAPLGCLLTRLRDEPHNFTISGLCDFVVQIASGMAYLESHRFVHRDLAARNLLLESYDKVKIGDFGMMRVLSEEDDHYTMHPSGKIPFAWCPQEVLKFRKFSHASDVWAFGITILELFSYGVEPWPGLNGAEVLDKVDMPVCERPKKPDHCPSGIYNILTAHCWAHEPHQRARFSVLKKMMDEVHPVNAAAVYPYESKCQENLCFKAGDIITLLDASPDVSWWKGQNMRTREVGMFPSELVDSGLRRAVSPVSHRISPKQRSSSKQPTWKCNLGPTCDCGSAHIYETPILLDTADLFSTSSRGSTLRSSRSVESDVMSSTEVDSGYSSSIDVRRFNSLNDENSPEQQKMNFGASYENTPIAVQGAHGKVAEYEFMFPAFNSGPASNPIDIPNQGCDSRYIRGKRNMLATPVFSEEKCPLDLSNLADPQLSGGKTVSTFPVAAKISASLPSTSMTQMPPPEPRLSETVSPPGSKKTSLDSGVGGSFGEEMATFLKEGNVQKSSDGPSSEQGEEDIYVELSRPSVEATVDPLGNRNSSRSSRDSLKAHYENSYENHCFPLMSNGQKEQGSVESGYDRIKCNSTYQPQSESEVRDVRSNTWHAQQTYDNHKLGHEAKDASSTQSCYYDNHKLQSLERRLPSPDVYDNWKIKNGACDVPSSYDNVKLSNREEIFQGTATSKAGTIAFSTKVENMRQTYENCFPKSAQTAAYENFTPKHLQEDGVKSDQEGLSKKFSENHEVFNRRKNNVEGLSSSLPENCCCVDLIPGDHDSMSIIVEKRSPPALTGARSVGFIERTDCATSVNKGGLNHPIPPPRWKRIARLSHPQSQVGCSEEKWSVSLNPEIASALRKRCHANSDSTSVGEAVAQHPQAESLGSEKPALPPHVEESSVVGPPKLPSPNCNAYENVKLKSKVTVEEVSSSLPPELPPKKKQSTGSTDPRSSNARRRALHYENVDVVNGFYAENNGVLASHLDTGPPPPLPRKMSQKEKQLCGTVPG